VLDTVMHHQKEGAIALLGNHDEAIFAPRDRTMHDDAQDAIEWTRLRISGDHLTFLKGLPKKVEVSDSLFVHANAYNPGGWQYLTEINDARKSLSATLCRFTFCGHVHQTDMYHQGATGRVIAFKPVAGVDVPLGIHRRWLVVLGSVGQPRDRNSAACYAVFDKSRNILTVHRVPYDTDAAARKISDAGLPDWLGMRLRAGV
jgi:diadenosine tetraphosphatase ApaH/serine/threonine PP2A family protein phosphatase